MTDKLEALRLEAETLSGLMMQLAENEIDSDSFAVMSDLGENGQEHDCDLPITETALRVSAVIDQLLAALEEKERIIDALAVLSREFTEANTRNFLRAVAAEQRLQQPIKLPKGFSHQDGVPHALLGTGDVMISHIKWADAQGIAFAPTPAGKSGIGVNFDAEMAGKYCDEIGAVFVVKSTSVQSLELLKEPVQMAIDGFKAEVEGE